MARTANEATEELYIGLVVTYTEWPHKPADIFRHYVGPYTTARATKGQIKEEHPHDVWEYLSWTQQQNGIQARQGVRRVDGVVLKAKTVWEPV